MRYEIQFRIIVDRPLPGVSMQVQRGKNELLPPLRMSGDSISFEFPIIVELRDTGLNFLGKYAQGPKDSRFVYVNSGSYAGQNGTRWNRRAKLWLMSITQEQVEEALVEPGNFIEVTMPGVGKDGGPSCASIKGLVWKVVRN